MSDDFPKPADLIQLGILLGIVATAWFTWATARAAAKQAALLSPVVRHSVSEGPGQLKLAKLSLDEEDESRFTLIAVSIRSPRKARLRRTRIERDDSGGFYFVPDGPKARSISADPGGVKLEFFIDPAGAEMVEVRAKLALRSALRQVSRCTTFIRIKD